VTRGTAVYIVQRLVLILFTTLAVSSIVFIGVHSLPGDAFLNERRSNPQAQAAKLHHYHLDLPLPQQYVLWLSGVVRGDLGESLKNPGQEVTPLLLREARNSLVLGGAAMLVVVGLGMSAGVIAALRQNTWVDYAASTAAVIGYSTPPFVTATLFILLTVTGFYNWTGGAIYEDIGWGKPEQVPVPAIALGIFYAAIIARLTRASMLETIRQDYVRTAWAKGLKAQVVVLKHALRNALIPVVTILGPLTAGIITGSVVIENIFGVPGLGKEFYTSILVRDYPITIGVFTFYAALVGLVNLAVDLVYPILDPRIRY
jgi:ABC-type dipeptide/oligopeptide/nickel transport system permease component